MSEHPTDEGTPDRPRGWLDEPKNVTRFVRVFYVVCGLVLLLDLLFLVFHKHVEHRLEGWFGFYPLYGFIGIVVLVLLSIVLRKLVMRPEDYYDA